MIVDFDQVPGFSLFVVLLDIKLLAWLPAE